jgi:hypothetical protein
MARARRGGNFLRSQQEIFGGLASADADDTPAHAADMTDSRDWVTSDPYCQ